MSKIKNSDVDDASQQAVAPHYSTCSDQRVLAPIAAVGGGRTHSTLPPILATKEHPPSWNDLCPKLGSLVPLLPLPCGRLRGWGFRVGSPLSSCKKRQSALRTTKDAHPVARFGATRSSRPTARTPPFVWKCVTVTENRAA